MEDVVVRPPPEPPEPIRKVPALTDVVPVYVFNPDSVSSPVPSMLSEPAPEIIPCMAVFPVPEIAKSAPAVSNAPLKTVSLPL